jgi:hypothetical protein
MEGGEPEDDDEDDWEKADHPDQPTNQPTSVE